MVGFDGQEIRGYRIVGAIGSGGYGAVYQAYQKSVGRDVAIKMILPQHANQPEFRQNFEAEARLVAQLEHPHIVPLYDFWQDEQGAFLVMRYIKGGSLRELLRKQGALSLAQVTRIVTQIAGALAVSHQAGVVHRDLKPDNILIDLHGNAYLTDFGIAKQTGQDNASATDAIKGTFAYLSPEQIQQTSVSPQTDIYALGIILFEMLAGIHPFHETPVAMMVVRHLEDPLPELNEVRPELPAVLAEIIERATAKQAADRFSTSSDLADALNDIATETKSALSAALPLKTTPSVPVTGKPPSTPEERNRHAMLQNVYKFWVEGVLENSLHGAAMIELGMQAEGGAVENPWDTLVRTAEGEERLAPGTRIADVFERLNGKLLVLGDPGGGKTTTMLDLARDLLARASADTEHPIPVVFNLSSWGEKRQPLTVWLVEELNSKYQVPRKVGSEWVEKENLLLLLDGLDEVAAEARDACVEAINSYREEHGFVDIVVCSRILDYEALTGRLNLNGAIIIQPLNAEQVDHYLTNLGPETGSIRTMLRNDDQLRELSRSPLMLSIMALAYRGVSTQNIPDFASVEQQRKHLFDTYVQRMFDRRMAAHPYTQQETVHYLSVLATKMQQHALSVFHIENIQPAWLSSLKPVQWSWILRLVYADILGLIAFITYLFAAPVLHFPRWAAVLFGVSHIYWGIVFTGRSGQKLYSHLLFALSYSIAIGIGFGAASTAKIGIIVTVVVTIIQAIVSYVLYPVFAERGNDALNIRPVEKISFSFSAVKPKYGPPVVGIFLNGFVIPFIMLYYQQIFFTPQILLSGLITWLAGSAFGIFVLGTTSGEVEYRTQPNQGIYTSLRNGFILLGVNAFLIFCIMIPILGINTTYAYGVAAVSLFFPPATWGTFMVFGGGYAVLQHVLLRFFLRRDNMIPANYAHFLDHAAALVLMRKVGGGYVFIHRYLLEYFADLEGG